jgi:predicted nucleic acid-binding protein
VKTRKVLDSYALLAYLQGEDGCAAVKDAFASSPGGVLMNEINVGEVYYILARGRGRERADYFLNAILPNLPIKVAGNDFDAVIRAARIKAEFSIAYADCFAVATAQRESAALLTGDREFKAVSSLVEIDWI